MNQGGGSNSMTAQNPNLLEPTSFSMQTTNNSEVEGVPIKKRRFPMPIEEQTSNSNSGAGVPIKKRRFPVQRPPSPPPQEHTNDSVASNSVGKIDAVKNPLLEVKKEIVVDPNSNMVSTGGNVNASFVKPKEPNLAATQSDVVAKSQLNLVPIANVGENVISRQVSLECKPELFPPVQALMGQNRDVSHQIPGLFCSLNKNKCIDRSKNVEKTVNSDNVVSANRSDWDLNTTMDAWGGSVSDAPPLDPVGFNGSSKIVCSLDTTPSLASHLEIGVNVDLGKQIIGAGDCRPDFPVSSFPSTQYRAEDMRHLSHSPPLTRANSSAETSGSLINIPFGSSASMPFSSPDNLASGSSLILSSGSSANIPISLSANLPSGSLAKVNSVGAKQDSVADTVNSVGAKQDSIAATVNSVGSSVKTEVVETCSKNVVEDRHIISEPTQDINKGTLILTESIVNRSAGTVLMLENSCSSLGLSSCSDVANQGHYAKKADIPVQDKSIVSTCRVEYSNVSELQNSRGSDDEKINISTDMMEVDSYGSDSESDGHATKGTRGGKEEEDYEDGEIRESLLQTTLDVPTYGKEENFADFGGCEIDNANVNQDQFEDKECGAVVSEDLIKECVDSGVEDRSDQILDKGVTLQEPLTVEVGPAVAEIENSFDATQRRLDGTQELSDKGTQTETAVGEVQNENDEREKEVSCLPTTDSSLNGQQDAAKDTNSGGGNGGGRSRIITLPRASNENFSDGSFVGGTAKERYTDFEGDKLHLQRNRDEIFTDGPRRFMRDRFQDRSFRSSRVRGRGGAYNRFDRSEWVSSDRKYNQENYIGPAEYRFSRNRHASAGDEEFESDGYPMSQDGRGGRKPLSDDFPSFRNPAPRRLSPRGNGGGPTTRGIQMVRRIERNISPNGEEASNMIGNGYGDKFTRNLADDTLDPMFTRSSDLNEGIEDQFPRANRKFSFVQRRGLPRVRSKSPMRTRTRSPGPWSSPPRRRSPDGYNGIQEMTRQRRSPPIYRMERFRSPPLNLRRGTPPYIEPRASNDFQRPIISNRRSPSDRAIPRNNRRFDNSLDLQERTNRGEYFEGPIRKSRFDEIDEEGTGNDRRKFCERRGGRGLDENFRFRQDGGPRPFRVGPKGDSEFVERSNTNSNNLREREFDRRIQNRPVIAPSRIRVVEEQEGDVRQGGPAWHDDSFVDASREKRRRF